MKREVYILQKEYKRGSKLCWECEYKSYSNADVLDKEKKFKDTKNNNYRVIKIIE